MADPADAALLPRWRGQRGRLEVWYLTATDATSGRGLWVHHEFVAPLDGSPPYVHGWIAVFDPARPPRIERFGPGPPVAGDGWLRSGHAITGPGRHCGRAATIDWDLTWQDPTPPLWPFPRWMWERELLPAAQVVGAPRAHVHGTVTVDGSPLQFDGPGAVAHICGHGNASRWGWLHADLGDGAVLEIVAAVSHRPGLSRLPPLAFVQLRDDGSDWPRRPELAALAFRTTLALPTWTVRGTVGRRRLSVTVNQPPDRCVRLGYVDPDGSTATCVNSETADAAVTLQQFARGWRTARSWHLAGTAHAEIGSRP